ncbi:MAG: hypothetical protein IK041_08510 [Bacteroidales bacterium]|nr:hypothetical protein [Bacteroidales bacterium]
MKKTVYLIAVLFCVGSVLASCKNAGKEGAPAEEKTDNESGNAPVEEVWEEQKAGENAVDLSRVPAHENTQEEDGIIEKFITNMYNNSLYIEESFLKEHCTESFLKQLRDDYDYEGEGYANWDFRSESNDGFGDNKILKFEKKDGRYYYEASDGGYYFRNIISAFVKDGKVMMDGIARDKSYVAPEGHRLD